MTNVQELERAFVISIIGLTEEDAKEIIGDGDASDVSPLWMDNYPNIHWTHGLPADHPYA